MRRIAIIGGGVAGVTAAWQFARSKAPIEAVLYEASPRLGGIVETVHEQGFIIECGPDSWVTEKPWAQQLALELGLGDALLPSLDATRKTYILKENSLIAMPDGMRMMVPSNLDALIGSPLFTEEAKQAFHNEILRTEELKAAAPEADESVASFIRRHFGDEVLNTVGAPLLSGVFGGNVETLSVRAVMAPFVTMERTHGSLIAAMQAHGKPKEGSVFTTLRNGLGSLIDTMATEITPSRIRLSTPVTSLRRTATGWTVQTASGEDEFDAILMTAPAHVASKLLQNTDKKAAELMQMEASSAVVVAFGFSASMQLPQGFGFLIPPGSHQENSLLAATFVDQKFDGRVPHGGRLIRAFFGGETGAQLIHASDGEIVELAYKQLEAILGHLPEPVVTVIQRWPQSLPQYSVGHLERMAELNQQVHAIGNLWLLGNGYRGVGLPDLIRDARIAADACIAESF